MIQVQRLLIISAMLLTGLSTVYAEDGVPIGCDPATNCAPVPVTPPGGENMPPAGEAQPVGTAPGQPIEAPATPNPDPVAPTEPPVPGK